MAAAGGGTGGNRPADDSPAGPNDGRPPPIGHTPAYGESYPGYPPAAEFPPEGGYPPPEYGAPYPGGYGMPAGPERTNPLAVISLVASVSGVFCGVGSVAGVVLGALALNQIKRSGQRGYGLAVAGIAVGVATFAVALIWMTYALG